MTRGRAFAPGRVTLMGDHTDYAAGRSLPIAIEQGTTADFSRDNSGTLRCESTTTGAFVEIPPQEPFVRGSFGAMLAGLTGEMAPLAGRLTVTSTLPIGAGLSSSASLLISSAMSLGVELDTIEMARLCQRAEASAGQAVGLLDQLAILAGCEANGVLIDFDTMKWDATPIDASAGFLVVHSGVDRSLASGGYRLRRSECAAATEVLGPLGRAATIDLDQLHDAALRRRARHVIEESARVDDMARALQRGDLDDAGALMRESHRSLRDDFDVSVGPVDDLVTMLDRTPGIFGARMTGGGFGGCVVALFEAGSMDASAFERGWVVHASDGARHLS